MGYLKEQGNIVKQLGSLQIIPGTSDAINSFVDNVTGETSKKQDEKIAALEAEVTAGRKTKEQAQAEMGMKAGGKVSSKLKSAGFYDKIKTTSERKKIVSKVTTKPQRVGMVEKLFSAKKMKAGGMASKRADGIAIKGKTRA